MNNYGLRYGYTSSDELDGTINIETGQFMSGYTVGILVQDVNYPLIPGNVVNAYTYDYPVRMEIVKGANQSRVHTADETLLSEIITACNNLISQGVRAIVGGCGYFGNYQSKVKEAVDAVVYLSSIIQIPWIRAGLKYDDEIGIICADIDNLSDHLFSQCGVHPQDREKCHIIGAGDMPEFSALLSRRGSFNSKIINDELKGLAHKLVDKHPRIKAILLECSDMPPYSAAIQKELGLPVYDFITMIDYAHKAVAQKPYYGFI